MLVAGDIPISSFVAVARSCLMIPLALPTATEVELAITRIGPGRGTE